MAMQQVLLSGGFVPVNPSIQKFRTKFIKKVAPLKTYSDGGLRATKVQVKSTTRA